MERDKLAVAAPEPAAAAASEAASTLVAASKGAAASSADGEEGKGALDLLAEVAHKTKAMKLTTTDQTGAAASASAPVENKKDREEESANSNKVLPVPASLGVPAETTTRKTRKLLVLNVSGLLADINKDFHNARLSHGRLPGKLVFKRPFCDDFLQFCFRNFEVGVWSSRMRHNVDAELDIVMEDFRDRLLFCWNASKCTATGLYSLENKDKALVLKELKKLWTKDAGLPWQQGEFSHSNTLLLDDSPYKALRNPPHTAIFPYPYSYKNRKHDSSLGPRGDVRLYLERLATADDVPRFVREHPFGQPPITQSDPNWNFYKRVLLDE